LVAEYPRNEQSDRTFMQMAAAQWSGFSLRLDQGVVAGLPTRYFSLRSVSKHAYPQTEQRILQSGHQYAQRARSVAITSGSEFKCISGSTKSHQKFDLANVLFAPIAVIGGKTTLIRSITPKRRSVSILAARALPAHGNGTATHLHLLTVGMFFRFRVWTVAQINAADPEIEAPHLESGGAGKALH
jgi:uncharacterized membrane protein